MTDLFDSAVETLRTFAESPKDEKCASNALATLSKLAKTSFGKKLNDLGFVENDDAFDLNAIFALNVLNELSTFNHKPLCDLSQSCSNIDAYVFIELVLAGFHRLAAVKDNLNTINVFPVPDGGTYFSNRSHSLKSSINSIFNLHICIHTVALYL